MSKKILSVVLALVFVMTTFAVSAFAVGGIGYEEDNTYTQTWALGEPVDNGNGTWSVDVSLTANYYVGAISFVVTNTNPTGAVLTSVTKGSALSYEANIQKNATGLVAIIPEPASDAEEGVDLTNGGVIATLNYTLADGATADIAIENAPKTSTNPGGDLIAVRLSDNNLTTATMIYGQTVTSVGEKRTLGAVAVAPELAVIDGTIGVIDTSRTMMDEDNGIECDGYLYGVDPYDLGETVDSVFEVIGDGEMEIVPNDAGSDCGTGTMVNVLDLDGNVVASYVLIIFGDVNGDGVADLTDVSNIELHDAYLYGDTGRLLTYQDFAGDINGDGATDLTDVSDLQLHDAYLLGDLGRIDIAGIVAGWGF